MTINKKRKKKKKGTVWRAILYTTLIVFILVLALAIIYCSAIFMFTEPIDTTLLKFNMSSVIYYENEAGEKVIIQTLHSDQNRTWAEIDEIPQNLKNAFIAIEDERFYSHPGFDVKRIGSAVLNTGLRLFDRNRSVYGGSTITQQLVKNLTMEDDRSILRKSKEIYRAYRLEQELTKNEILELYLNTIYLSQNCNGVASASKVYFAKDLSELSLAECASIAGITQHPSRYDPYINREANKEKQELVLSKMLELGMISESEYNDAVNEELVFERADEYAVSYYSYFVDTLIDEVLDDLVNKHNYSPAMAQNVLYTGGLQIKCTIDPEIQAILEDVYTNEENYIYSGDQLLQSAMVITEASTGEIKGVVGGMGDKTGSRTFNRATSLRQPGSSIKPLSVYAPALDYGIINAATVLDDVKTTFELSDGSTWTPKNSGNSFSDKKVSLRRAIAKSLNVTAAQVLDNMGIDRSYNFLEQSLGITSLVESKTTSIGVVSDKALAPLSLGGLTDGISPIEIASAYVPFINDGYYIQPHTYTEIYDHNNEILFRKQPTTHRAMKSTTATIMTDLLKTVVTEGTGTAAHFSGVELAGKTGTAEKNHDKWFVGMTPSLVGATWVGYDNPLSITTAGNPAAKLWKEVMSKIDYSDKPTAFSEVLSFDNLDSYGICTVSGKFASEHCRELSTVFYAYLDENSAKHIQRCNEADHEPEEPETPEEPDVPTVPDEPTEPETPEEPDEPTVPEEPTEPETPDIPIEEL